METRGCELRLWSVLPLAPAHCCAGVCLISSFPLLFFFFFHFVFLFFLPLPFSPRRCTLWFPCLRATQQERQAGSLAGCPLPRSGPLFATASVYLGHCSRARICLQLSRLLLSTLRSIAHHSNTKNENDFKYFFPRRLMHMIRPRPRRLLACARARVFNLRRRRRPRAPITKFCEIEVWIVLVSRSASISMTQE